MADPTPPEVDEPWQDDRPVFERDEAKKICVSPSAREHWSDANPKKFTPEIALKVVQYVGAGCFIETAAAAAGLCKMTLYNWMKRAESENSTEELRAWKRLLDEAEANAEARAVAGIQEAGAGGQWQAYAWYLERKHWSRWGKKDTSMLANPDGTPLTPQQVAFTIVDPKKKDEPEEQPAA